MADRDVAHAGIDSRFDNGNKHLEPPSDASLAFQREFQAPGVPDGSWRHHAQVLNAKDDLIESLGNGDFKQASFILEKSGACNWAEMLYQPHGALLQAYDSKSGKTREFVPSWNAHSNLGGKTDYAAVSLQEITGTKGFLRDLMLTAGLVQDDFKKTTVAYVRAEPCKDN